MVSLALRMPLTMTPLAVVSPSPSTAMANTSVGVRLRNIQLLSAQLCIFIRLGSSSIQPIELSLACLKAVAKNGLFI